MHACPRCGRDLPDGPARVCAACEVTVAPDRTVAHDPATAPPSAAPATTVRTLGRYRLLSPLGSGGMGVVWKAEDEMLRRTVALKLIRPEGAGGEEALARFEREARLAARLRHPGIVSVHDVGVADGERYIAMEYVEGRTFAAWHNAMRERPEDERRRKGVVLLAGIADAVAYAHSEGVVHRDLKPGNVLLDREDRPRVMDFGLAREVSVDGEIPSEARLTLSGHMLGTPSYMSPEQASGDLAQIGPRTDVWALGAMLHEVLTGAPPFIGGNVWEVVRAVLQDDVAAPSGSDPSIPAGLESVCLRALEKEPGRRYAGAAEFAAELRRWLDGKPVLARPLSRPDRARRWLRRRWRRFSAAGAILLLALGAFVWTQIARRAAEARELARVVAVREELAQAELNIGKSATTREVRDNIASQSQAVIEGYLETHPGFGPAIAWRGRIKELRGDLAAAEADFDLACATSPEQAVVWLRRAGFRFDHYLGQGALPALVVTPEKLTLTPIAFSPERAARLADALSDLARMDAAPVREPYAREEDLRFLHAAAEFYRGGESIAARVIPLLEGIERHDAWRLRGLALYCDRRFGAAEAAMARCLEFAPHDHNALTWHGQFRYAQAMEEWAAGRDPDGALDAAVDDFGAALQQEEEQSAVHGSRAMALLVRADWKAAHGGDPREDYRQAVLDFGVSFDAHNAQWVLRNRAVSLIGLGDAFAAQGRVASKTFAAAVADLDAALQGAPGDAELFVLRGQAQTRLGAAEEATGGDPQPRLERAIEDFSAALARAPRHAEALVGRGDARTRSAEAQAARGGDPTGLLRSAEEDLDAAIAADPKDPEAWRKRAHCRMLQAAAAHAQGQDPGSLFARAIDDLTEALHLHPQSADRLTRADAHAGRSRTEAASGRDPLPELRAAIDDWSAAIAAGHAPWEAYAQRGESSVQLAQAEAPAGTDPRPRLQSAIADYSAALRLNPDRVVLRNARANAWLNVGNAASAWGEEPAEAYLAAESDYHGAIDAGYAAGWFNLGLLYHSERRLDEERDAYMKGLASARDRAAWVAARERESASARVLADQPWAGEWSLGTLSLQFGRRDLAQARYERGFALLDAAWKDLPAEERSRRETEPHLREAIVNAHYNLACLESLRAKGAERAARLDSAFAQLAEILRLGFKDFAALRHDADLAAAREDPRFEKMLSGGK